jgi:CubicO group peptidase (beta-lactamase class C family)
MKTVFVRAFAVPLKACAAALALLTLTGHVSAQSSNQKSPSAAFSEAVQSWMDEYGVKGAVLAVKRNGNTIVDIAFGDAAAQQVVPLQSLSKAITAACVATLVRDNKIGFRTPLSEALRDWFKRYGEPADPRFLSATVEQLISHRSGLPGNEDSPSVFWSVLRQHLKTNTIRQPDDDTILVESLKQPMPRSPGDGYAYSNIGYTALSVVIRELSGLPYDEYCQRSVLQPLGVTTARLAPQQRLLSGGGGWEMTGNDYLTFYEALATGKVVPASLIEPWIREQRSLPGNTASPVWYGLGTNVREGRQGQWRYFHGGDWDWRQPDAQNGPLHFSESSYVARLEDGTSWFVAWHPRRNGFRRALEQNLWKAYRSIWP